MKTCIQCLLIVSFFFCGSAIAIAQSSPNVKVVGDSVDDANSDKPNTQSHQTRTIIHTGNRGTTSASGNEGKPSNTENGSQAATPASTDTGAQAASGSTSNQDKSSTNVTGSSGTDTSSTNCGHFCWGWLGLLGLIGLAGLIKRNPNT